MSQALDNVQSLESEMLVRLETLADDGAKREHVLSVLTSNNLMMRLFEDHLQDVLGFSAPLTECRSTVLKKRLGSRQVVAYELSLGETSKIEVVAKRYADRDEGIRCFETMKMLWDAGLRDSENFRIPEPLAFLSDLRMMVQQKATGNFLFDRLGTGREEVLADFRSVASWLATLHQLDPPATELLAWDGSDDDVAAVTRFSNELIDKFPNAGDEIERIRSPLIEKFHAMSGQRTAIVHGDFHPENIFVSSGVVTVIDFDQACTSDPARDLGYFTAQIRSKVLLEDRDPEPFNREIRAFLGTYVSHLSESDRISMLDRTMAYGARTVLEILYYKLCVLADPRTDSIKVLLEEAKRFVDSNHPAIEISEATTGGPSFE
ncbi:aminoglycoside phosphotransferase family protein [Myxococcota bacterium]|nr:aminoglycoside phosphotransferase family protein [Myxococcota bacterium]